MSRRQQSCLIAGTAALLVVGWTAGAVGAEAPNLPRKIVSVTFVKQGSPAARAGIRRGDVLVSIDGREVKWEREDAPAITSTNLPQLTGLGREGGGRLKIVRGREFQELALPEAGGGNLWRAVHVTAIENVLSSALAGGKFPGRAAEFLRRSVFRAAALDWSAATEFAELALDAGGENADLLAYMGSCYAHLPKYDKAEACCRRALRADPDHVIGVRTLASVLAFTGRPAEALKPLGKLRGLGALNDNDERVESTARFQARCEGSAKMDMRRRKLGVLPDLLSPDTPTRKLPIREQFPFFRGDTDGGRDRPYDFGPNSATSFSNFRFSATVRLNRVYHPWEWVHAGIFLTEVGYYLGVGAGGDVVMKDGKHWWRLVSLDCVKPSIGGNRITIVRHGSRIDGFVNGTYVSSFCGPEDPGKITWRAYGLGARFVDFELEVPGLAPATRAADSGPAEPRPEEGPF